MENCPHCKKQLQKKRVVKKHKKCRIENIPIQVCLNCEKIYILRRVKSFILNVIEEHGDKAGIYRLSD